VDNQKNWFIFLKRHHYSNMCHRNNKQHCLANKSLKWWNCNYLFPQTPWIDFLLFCLHVAKRSLIKIAVRITERSGAEFYLMQLELWSRFHTVVTSCASISTCISALQKLQNLLYEGVFQETTPVMVVVEAGEVKIYFGWYH